MSQVRIGRVVLYSFLTLVAGALGALPFGLVQGYLAGQGGPVPAWLGLVTALAGLVGITVAFAWIARREAPHAPAYGLAVFVGSCLLGIPLDAAVSGFDAVRIALSIATQGLAALVGTGIGMRWPLARRPLPDDEPAA
jgi:hypothetical protein